MVTPYLPRRIEAPHRDPENRAYWDAATRGKLLLKWCKSCGNYHHYPRALCPYCMSDRTVWKEAIGTGLIYSFSVTRRAGPIPYVIAYVTLDEGPTMLTNIVDCDLDAIRIQQRVRVVFKPSGDSAGDAPPVPCFVPV